MFRYNYIFYGYIYKCFECFTMRVKPDDDLCDDEENYYVQHMNRY
jgi:hypothetical protein